MWVNLDFEGLRIRPVLWTRSLKSMKVLTKGIYLDIQINHRISCWQAFAAVFLQMMVLFEGFYTLQ